MTKNVSIILPALNDIQSCRLQIQALTNQTIQPKEIIIIDSSSDEKIQEYIDHRKMRNAQILRVLSQAPNQSPLQIAQIIYDLPKHFYPIAAKQVLCHLQYLEANQKVKSQGSSFIRI